MAAVESSLYGGRPTGTYVQDLSDNIAPSIYFFCGKQVWDVGTQVKIRQQRFVQRQLSCESDPVCFDTGIHSSSCRRDSDLYVSLTL